MNLQLYNTLGRAKQAFTPVDPGHVRIYVCGPTVYDYAHIGNARPVVVFDVLYRLLQALYPRVSYVRNITDVDDKIIAAAAELGEPIAALTQRFIAAFHHDMAALGALDPDAEPRATDHIAPMIAMIEALIGRGHAYEADGHVLFAVATKSDYGKLSRHNREELIAGARVEVAPYKRDPADFVLWKPSTGDQPGWDSPWGTGRPGWHLECSVMSEKHLGVPFDIHGGGQDLIFPHHENEIAQSECARDDGALARMWMHNGYLTVNGEKMSKSLGNFITVRELLGEGQSGEAIRLALLMGHYRQPIDFSREKISEAKAQLDRLYGALRGNSLADLDNTGMVVANDPVQDALEDDLNTPNALHYLHLQANAVFEAEDATMKLHHKWSLRRNAALMGLVQADPEEWFKGDAPADEDAGIQELIDARSAARKEKDFAEADRIRDALAADGIVLEDSADGTIWRRGA